MGPSQPPCASKKIFSDRELADGVHRCRRIGSSRVGFSLPGTQSSGRCGLLDSGAAIRAPKNSSQGDVRSLEGSRSCPKRISPSFDHRLKNSQKFKTRPVLHADPSSLGSLRAEKRRDSPSYLDQWLAQCDSGSTLPARAIADARKKGTLYDYAKRFERWSQWLDLFKFQRSPQRLWLYLDLLRGSVEGRSARAVR